MLNGPCRYSGDSSDNLIIAAHNFDAHFGRLKELSDGDKVVFEDIGGRRFEYELVRSEKLGPSEISNMIENNPALTLFTCTPGGKNRAVYRFSICCGET